MLVRLQKLGLSARELLPAQKRDRGVWRLGANKFEIDADHFPIGALVAKTVFLETLVQFLAGVARAFVCIISMEGGGSCDCITAAKSEFYSIITFSGSDSLRKKFASSSMWF
jgi:hypothetical protein